MDGPVATFKEENEVLYHNLLKNSSIKTKTHKIIQVAAAVLWPGLKRDFFLKQQQQKKTSFSPRIFKLN